MGEGEVALNKLLCSSPGRDLERRRISVDSSLISRGNAGSRGQSEVWKCLEASALWAWVRNSYPGQSL